MMVLGNRNILSAAAVRVRANAQKEANAFRWKKRFAREWMLEFQTRTYVDLCLSLCTPVQVCSRMEHY